MKQITKILILLIFFSSTLKKDLYSQIENYYYIGIGGAVYGGYKLFNFVKKNQNPDAKKFKKNVKNIEEILSQNSSDIFPQKTNLILLFVETESLNKKAKEKPMTFHSKHELYYERYEKAINEFNNLLYNQIENNYKKQIDLFNSSIQKNNLNKAKKHSDTLALIYNSVTWVKESSIIKNIKETHVKLLATHNSISNYLQVINKLLKINNNYKIDNIINLLDQKTSEYEKAAKFVNVAELYSNEDKMIFALIKENYNHYINTLEIPNTKNAVDINISTLKKYKNILNDPSIENQIINQQKYYNKILLTEISNNIDTISKTSQIYDNIRIIENLLNENNKLFSQIDSKLVDKNELNKIKQRNENYIVAKNKIIERQNEKIRKEEEDFRKQQEYYNRNYYNGHKIYTGPRGGRYYINSKGNKVYIKK